MSETPTIFLKKLPSLPGLRANINEAYRMDETRCVHQRIKQAELPKEALDRIEQTARELVIAVRKKRKTTSGLDAFLYEYDLSSTEGVALMCLAEAMLRVPDEATIHQLIRDKITPANWKSHAGKSESFYVNAATWGLMLTGKIMTRRDSKVKNLNDALQRFLERSSQPVVHEAVRQAMKILGQQFVMGRTIKEALKRGEEDNKMGYCHSFDMLGEAARTAEDAQRYFESYKNAILALKEKAKGKSVYEAPGISIKLSALHPRYEFTQWETVFPELLETVKKLAVLAKEANIGFTIDAEEADRLDLSLDIVEAIFKDPELKDWHGFGLAVQAYQKRALLVIEWLTHLAHSEKRRINVRLVKGAYWDYEIKDSQMKGLKSYPVFTRKVSTDISYIACAKKMIAAQDAIYCQFGTHNAQTVATILELMGKNRDFEFQCLHGMGHALYDELVGKDNIHCRIYAPVGSHEDLLPYLVRRLLENGANTSFVNRIIDDQTPIKDLIIDPIAKLQEYESIPHSRIPLPENIFGPERKNSLGLDLSDRKEELNLNNDFGELTKTKWTAKPSLNKNSKNAEVQKITNPADRKEVVGEVVLSSNEDVQTALKQASAVTWDWDHTPVDTRASYIERAADLLEENMSTLMEIAIREAGKNIFDSLGEVREAVDACRYYAMQARKTLVSETLQGYTGEFDQLQMHGKGIAVCISPWNFPLAIFTSQIVAALVAGNPVIAKPAEQTPLMAAKTVELLHQAGIPKDVLQLLPGRGEVVGADLVADPRVRVVIFTGSTETAKAINKSLANREGAIPTLIAETGGQNAFIVDSTALPEQVVVDVINSSFNSAGQRCSASRVLFLQEEIADKIIHMLQGAMQELKVGDPMLLQTDVGPVIDEDARSMLEKHVDYLKQQNAKLIYQVEVPDQYKDGTFFAPRAYEIPNLSVLKREVFGPILHVIRYAENELDQVIDEINHTGYGLTLGIHTRINEKVEYIQSRIRAGNAYVNRNIIGAVIGVQPFGGENLSGTGPKAGGPHYLLRLVTERTLTINTTAAGGNASLMTLGD